MSLVGLFDMDGTLFDYDKAVLRDLEKIRSENEPKIVELYNLDDIPWLKARIDMIRTQPGWWKNLQKYQPGWDVYKIAARLGFCIEILTKGPSNKPAAWSEKVECLQKHFRSDVIPNIVGKSKKRYYGRFLCDDYPKYCEEWLEHRPRGLVIMPAHYYNVDFVHPRVIRYDGSNLEQVRAALKVVKKRKDGQPLDLKGIV